MKLLAHVMPWFGDGKIHRMASYTSNVAQVVANQIAVLQTVRCFGVQCQGVIMTWQGNLAAFQHSAVMEWNTQCDAAGMLFCLLMDPWIAKPGNIAPNPASVIAALNHADAVTMFNSPSYVPEKYLLDFSIAGSPPAFNVATDVMPHLNEPWVLLSQSSGFAWPSIPSGTMTSETRNQLSVNDLASQHGNQAMQIPAVMMQFNDSGVPTPIGVSLGSWTGTRDYSQSVWSAGSSPARVLDAQGGKLFFDYWATVPGSAPYLGLVTWNDYDERTAVEDYYAMLAGIRIGS